MINHLSLLQIFSLLIILFANACSGSLVVDGPAASFTPTQPIATPTSEPTPTIAPTDTPAATFTPFARLPVTQTKDIVYAKRTKPKEYPWHLDEYTPAETGNWPVVVFLHGMAGEKSDYEKFGYALAETGVTVFVISYPDTSPKAAIEGNARGYREMTEVAACALRFARARALEDGNNAPTLTIVGFSLGGGIGSYVALVEEDLQPRWEAYASARGGPATQTVCEADADIQVDALVGIAGVYSQFIGIEGKSKNETWIQAQDPDLWQMLHSAIGENQDLKIRLLSGKLDFSMPDEDPVALEAVLSDLGYNVELILMDAGHTVPQDLTIQTILHVVSP